MTPPSERWHVISSERLIELLRRAREGENPDLIYLEEYVNAEREEVPPYDDRFGPSDYEP